MRELLLGARLTLAGGRTRPAAHGDHRARRRRSASPRCCSPPSLPTIHAERQARDAGARRRRRAERASAGRPLLVADAARREFRGRGHPRAAAAGRGRRRAVPPGLTRAAARRASCSSRPRCATLLATPDGPARCSRRGCPAASPATIGADRAARPERARLLRGRATTCGVGGAGPAHRRASATAGAGRAARPGARAAGRDRVRRAADAGRRCVVGAAVRTGGEERDRRLAALRLVGADQRMARRIAAGEALVGAALGLARSASCSSSSRAAFVERRRVPGPRASSPATCARRPLLGAAGRASACPAAAVVVTLLALRRVVAEPLGVVRRAEAGAPRRLWWRLVLPLGRAWPRCCPPTAQDEDERQPSCSVALGDHRAARRRRGAAAVGGRARRRAGSARARSRGSSPSAACSSTPAAPARAVSGIAVAVAGRDRAADGLHRRAGRLQAGDGRRPGPRAAVRRPRRRRVRRGRARRAAARRSTACARSTARDASTTGATLRRPVRGAARARGDPRAARDGDTFVDATPGPARGATPSSAGAARTRPARARRRVRTTPRRGREPTAARLRLRRAPTPPRTSASATPRPRSTRCRRRAGRADRAPTPSSPCCGARCSRARRS